MLRTGMPVRLAAAMLLALSALLVSARASDALLEVRARLSDTNSLCIGEFSSFFCRSVS